MANRVPGFKGIDKSHSQAILAEMHHRKAGVRGRFCPRPDSAESDFRDHRITSVFIVAPAKAGGQRLSHVEA